MYRTGRAHQIKAQPEVSVNVGGTRFDDSDIDSVQGKVDKRASYGQ